MVWTAPKLPSLQIAEPELDSAQRTGKVPKRAASFSKLECAHELASDGAFWALHEEVQVLGKGSYGTVKLTRERSTGNLVAVKEVVKGDSSRDSDDVSETSEAEVLHMLMPSCRHNAGTAPARIGGRRASERSGRQTLSELKAAMQGSGPQPGGSPSSVISRLHESLGSAPAKDEAKPKASSVGASSAGGRRKPHGQLSLWQLQAALCESPPIADSLEPPQPAQQSSPLEVAAPEENVEPPSPHDTVRLLDVYDTPSTLFLVMRAEMGGDLAARLASLPGGVCPEAEARRHAASLLRGLESAHAQGIVHRDIKAANVLLSQEGVGRLGDFGLATNLPEGGELLTAVCGTHDNMAPEMVLCGHGEAAGYDTGVDMWQLGLLLFEMLFGRHPFAGETEVSTLAAILQGGLVMPETAVVSEPARHLVRRLLVADPAERLSASQCLDHPWLCPRS